MHGSGGPARSFSRQREIAKKEKCMKRRKNGTALILLFVSLLLLVGLTSCAPDPPTDADALRGQWAVYANVDDPDTPEKEEEFDGVIIDIQYTVPGYWCFGLFMILVSPKASAQWLAGHPSPPETRGRDRLGKQAGRKAYHRRQQEK